jgi:hypothetical protein
MLDEGPPEHWLTPLTERLTVVGVLAKLMVAHEDVAPEVMIPPDVIVQLYEVELGIGATQNDTPAAPTHTDVDPVMVPAVPGASIT